MTYRQKIIHRWCFSSATFIYIYIYECTKKCSWL